MARGLLSTSSPFLRAVFAAALLAGCGDDANSFPTGDYDADLEVDAAIDSGGPLEFDVVSTDIVSPQEDRAQPVDTFTPVDRPTPPVDNGPPPTDTPASVCPSSCGSNADCNPCRSPGETGNYCCISGLCLYMTDMCSATVPSDVPPGGGGDGGGGDGGAGGADAGAGLDAAGGADAAGGFDAGGGAG
ncbi:MAG: hypothetical protein R3A48_06590 [Polyangiales bacterium]